MTNYIKSPLNYVGGKHKLLHQLLPKFPQSINTFVDLFCGGCNVAINTTATNYICNDNLTYLIDLYKALQTTELVETLKYVDNQIATYSLSQTNENGYNAIRDFYNEFKNPLDLFVVIAYSFNYQIRFNNTHKYNNAFGRNRSHFNSAMRANLTNFVNIIKDKCIQFTNKSFTDFDISNLGHSDFVYCDPPYLISTGSYNDGKRGFLGWDTTHERELLNFLDILNAQNVKFALSNVVEHKGLQNNILLNWLKDRPSLIVYDIQANYTNSNYQIANKSKTRELLITNYKNTETCLF